MPLRLHIETDNAAFSDDDGGPELARILRDLARKISDAAAGYDDSGPVIDSNGNKVGRWSVSL